MPRNRHSPRLFLSCLEPLEERLVLDDASAGYFGVNSRFLTTPNGDLLTGLVVGIGQVESSRPAHPNIDTPSHRDVTPAVVYQGLSNASANSGIQAHATAVAGVMIANSTRQVGVSPRGVLFEGAIASAWTLTGSEQNDLLAAQHVASRNNGDVRAINYSAAINHLLIPPNGRSLISAGLDWLSSAEWVLGVYALGNIPPPRSTVSNWGPLIDNYNGIVVGATESVLTNGQNIFRRFAGINANSVPRDTISVPRIFPNAVSGYVPASGTSYATPHVTATVALLGQYGDARLATQAPEWNPVRYKAPPVMKAALLNSADKVQDAGNGRGLDMEKTIVKRDGATTWTGTAAYAQAEIPLDDELGAGQLNVRQALNQFSSGDVQFRNADRSARPVPTIGGSWGDIEAGNDRYARFVFDRPLKANSSISITLTWNRAVSLNEDRTWWGAKIRGNRLGRYDTNEDFTINGFDTLDLYLLRRGTAGIANPISVSRSEVDNVEYIFAQIPEDGEYEFWVRRPGSFELEADAGTPFSVAWWAVGADPNLPGRLDDRVWEDLNEDGLQDAGEPGVAGVRVYLYKPDGTYVATTITNANGNYEFRFLPQGDYYMSSFLAPQGMRRTRRWVRGTDETDSDVREDSGYTFIVTVGAGAAAVNLSVDAGLIRLARVRGRGWLDNNSDGTQQASEPGAPNVRVDLFTAAGNWIDATVTDSEGNDGFDSLDPGSYFVRFGRLPGRPVSPSPSSLAMVWQTTAPPSRSR